mgnify:CR=1 FL=1
MAKERILIVDDDPAILKLVGTNLKARGYEVLFATNGEEAIQAIEGNFVDLMVLDLMMPGMDGVAVCQHVREWTTTPIVILSARGDENDKVKCLELGADDYLTKPFGIAELIARVRNALRHRGTAPGAVEPASFSHGGLDINFASRQVTLDGKDITLTQTEFNLLRFMVLNANKALTHHLLLTKVWGEEYSSEKEYLRVFVSRIRRKLKLTPDRAANIQTIPGVGYIFSTNGDQAPSHDEKIAVTAQGGPRI